MSKWNADQYEKFIKSRTQPAIDLANRLKNLSPENILDIGCGTGNSTKVLKDKFPYAEIIGADNSEEMLLKARKNYSDIEFIKADAGGDMHEITKKYDIIFSNACIQWIPNHKKLLPKLMAFLKNNGTLAIQIPIQRKHPVHIIIGKLSCTEKWKNKITPRQYNNLTTEEYFDILSYISNDFELWETTYCHRMPDYESIIEWYKGTGLRPYLEQLCQTDRNEFIRDFYLELKKRYAPQKNGEILLEFPRLFFTATKK